jgi:DUF1680 family protein
MSDLTVIEPFNYASVQLRPGMFKDQFEHTKNHFLSIPNDDLLKPFREKAGLDAPGEDLGGWYNYPATLFQWLGAFAQMYSVTGDPKLLEKVEYLLSEWGKTIDAGAFVLSAHHYGFDKTAGGLVDVYAYTGNEDAVKYLHKVTDYAMETLNRRKLPATRTLVNAGGVVNGTNDLEWYTASENLYRAYLATGDTKFRDFAEIWHYDHFWDRLARKENAMVGVHAYSHVNSLSGAAEAFAVSRNPIFLRTITNAYDILQETQCFATGGYGHKELLAIDGIGTLGESLYDMTEHRKSFETPCCTWAGFKLARYLMKFTGEARYGDWIEKLAYNAIGAALPMGEDGKTYYYSDYSIRGAQKAYLNYPPEGAARWPCCSGTYPQAVTAYHDLIYYSDSSGLYVNLFVPSSVEWDKSGTKMNLTQETDFPESGNVSLKLDISEQTQFALRFRIPEWVHGTVQVEVNGKPVSGVWKSGNWGTIERTWQDGDVIKINLPMQLQFLPIDNIHPNVAALLYGPVVLVADKEGTLYGDMNHPEKWIAPSPDGALTFETSGQPTDKKFRPYYAYGLGERYFIYQEFE